MRVVLACLAAVAVFAAAGCNGMRETKAKAAIREAIEAHLKQRPNLMLANVTLELRDVRVSGDSAEAEVRFQSKQPPDLSVGVRYVLRRTGNRWEVISSSGMARPPHAAQGAPAQAPAESRVPLESSH